MKWGTRYLDFGQPSRWIYFLHLHSTHRSCRHPKLHPQEPQELAWPKSVFNLRVIDIDSWPPVASHQARGIPTFSSSNQRSPNSPYRRRSSSFFPTLFPPRIGRTYHYRIPEIRSNNLRETRNECTSDYMDQTEIYRGRGGTCKRRNWIDEISYGHDCHWW